MVKRYFPTLAIALATLLPSRASANPLDSLGFGSREIALGGAVAADVEDSSAVYYNPAGLARGDELRLSVGYMSLQSMLRIDGRDSDVDPISGINVGIVAPIKLGPTRLAFGLGLHLPDQRISRTRSVLLEHPRWELYDTRPHKIFLSAAIAFQPTSRIRFGGGMTFQSPSRIALELRGSLDFLRPDSSALEHRFDGNLLSVRYPHAGVQVDIIDELSMGLAYRGRLRVATSLEANVGADILGIGEPAPLDFSFLTQGVSTYFPQQFVLSLAARPLPSLRLGFDLTYLDWSKHESLIANDEVSIAIELPPELGISLPSQIVGRKAIPMNLHDRFVPRFGVEYQARDDARFGIAVRGGYALERSPFPTQSGATNFVDNTRHSISVGMGLELRDLEPTISGALRIDAHLLYAFLPEREHTKSSPVDPVGDYRSSGNQVGFGLQVGVLFE